MDSIEIRLNAVEMLFIKVGSRLEPGALEDISRSIEADIAAASSPDLIDAARLALALIETARAHICQPRMTQHVGPERGMF